MNEPIDSNSNFNIVENRKRGNIRKWMLRIPLYFIFCMMLLVATGVLLLQTGLVRNKLRVFLIETANRHLNATVGIESINGNLLTDISLEGISVTNPENQPIIFLESVSARYLLPMLLAKVIHINDTRIKGLRLNLDKSIDGRWNYSTLLKASEKTEKNSPASAGFPFLLVVKRFDITDGLLALNASGQDVTANRSLQIDRFAGRFEYGESLKLSILKSSLTFNAPEALSIAMEGKAAFDPGTADIKIDHLTIQSGPSTIGVDGTCRLSEKIPVFDCRIGLDSVDIGDVCRKLRLSAIHEGTVTGDISASGTTAAFRHHMSLRKDDAVLDVNGSAGLDDLGFRVALSGGIRNIDLSGLRVPYTGHLSGIMNADVILTAAGLQQPATMDARAALEIRGVSAADIPLDAIRLDVGWSHGKLAVDQLEVVSGTDRFGVSGSLEPSDRRMGLDFTVNSEQPEMLLDRLSKRFPQFPAALTLKGKTDITAAVSGWFDNPHSLISIRSGVVSWDRVKAKAVRLTGVWQGLPGPGTRIDDLRFTAREMGTEQIDTGMLSLTGDWHGWIDNPRVRFSINTRNVAGDRLKVEAIDLKGGLQGLPDADDSRADLMLNADGVRMDGIESGTISLSGSWRGPLSRYVGHTELNASEIGIENNLIKSLSLTADVTPGEAVVSISAEHENGSRFEIDGKAAPWTTPDRDITIASLHAVTFSPWPESSLKNKEPIHFSLAGANAIKVDTCRLEMNDAKIGIEGDLSTNGNQSLKIVIDNLELSDIPGTWNTEAGISGTVSAETSIQGTLEQPVVSSHVNLKNLLGYGISQVSDLDMTVGYAGETATVEATLSKQDMIVLSASGNAPLRFSLMPFKAAEAKGNLEAVLETRELRFSELPIPPIKDIEWDALMNMNLTVNGSFREPDLSGDIAVNDGFLTLTRNKLTYEKVNGKLSLANNQLTIEELTIAGDREGRLNASGMIIIGDKEQFNTDVTIVGDNFFIPFQKAVTARISPRLHLTGGMSNPSLMGEVAITESKINIDRLAGPQYSDIQVIETVPENSDVPLVIASESNGPDYLSPFSADILVRVPKNAWLKGQDVNVEIAGEVSIKKRPGGPFLLSGPLHTLRGNYYFMGKNFHLTRGEVDFLGLKEINPSLNIEARTRIKSTDIIITLRGFANEIAIDLSSDPVMEESDIISYLVFGKASDSLGGSKAFNVEKAALNYTSGLLAAELRSLLGDVFFIDSFAIDPGSSDNGFGSVTLGKYITPEIFISHRQGLSEYDPSYEEITYELTPQLKLEAQIGRDSSSSADLTWEFDF